MYVTDGLTMEVIAERLRVSVGLVSKVVRLHRLYGQVTNPFSHRTGQPPFLENDDLQFISTILNANPGLYLDEIQDKLAAVCDVQVSQVLAERQVRERSSLDEGCR
jgi:transposase